MSQTDFNTILIWGGVCCLLMIGVGAYRAWKAGHGMLAMLPIGLLLLGLFIVPFILGAFGVSSMAAWIGRAFIPLAALTGACLAIKYSGKASVQFKRYD